MILLSIRPRFAEQIVLGTKRIEFRRTWTRRDVEHMAIYSSAPIKKIIATAIIEDVIRASPAMLWRMASQFGGGVTRGELLTYLDGRREGFGIILSTVSLLHQRVELQRIVDAGVPQSFRYLSDQEKLAISRATCHGRRDA